MLLLYKSVQIRNPNYRFLFNSNFLSFYSSQSSINPNEKSPPRKGRQAVRRILKLLSSKPQQNPNFYETLKILETSPQSLSSSQASSLITAISNPLISFDFYRFLKSLKPLFKLDSVLFATLIKSQLQSINPKLFKIEFYFSEMKKHKVCLSKDDLTCLFEMFVVDYVEIAEFFVKEVLEKHEYDESSYNVLISIYTKYGMCEDAILIVEKAKARFEKLGLGFYACLMDVYKVNGNMRAAMKAFMEMEDKGIVADEGIYMALLRIFCRGGSVKLCSVVLEEMRRVGCRPDEGLRMDLMKLFLKEGMVREAEILAKDEFLKDSESMPAVVEALADKGRPLEALEIIKNMRKSGKNVDGCVYASLIHGCGKIGLIEEAEKVFENFKLLEGAENAEKFESVYTSMVYLYSKTEMREKAEMFFNQMEGKLGFVGSKKVFSYMMSMYGALGLFNDVERMFERWKRSCFSLNVDAYAVLLEALSKSGKMNRARDFLFEMRSSGMHPNNSIYSSLMEGYLLLGLVNHAVALLDEYKLLGLEMDALMASSVISTLIQADRYMDLGVYLEKITRQGITIPQDKGMFLVKMCGDSSCLEKLGKLLLDELPFNFSVSLTLFSSVQGYI